MSKKQKPDPLAAANLTRVGYYADGCVSYSSRKKILTDRRIGFSSADEDALTIAICGGVVQCSQQWWVTLSDDDDWWASKDFPDRESAVNFYLKSPIVVGWDWLF